MRYINGRQFELPLVPPVERSETLKNLNNLRKHNPRVAEMVERLMSASEAEIAKCEKQSLEGLICRMHKYKLMLAILAERDYDTALRDKLNAFYRNFGDFWRDIRLAEENTGNLQSPELSVEYGSVLELMRQLRISEDNPWPTYCRKAKHRPQKPKAVYWHGNPNADKLCNNDD